MTIKPHGIIAAMVTPLTTSDEIHESAIRSLTNYLIDGGVQGLLPLGSQGEFWAFSPDEKQRIWRSVVEEASGRVPVYAGTAAISTRETVALTRLAEEAGVDAAVILTPFYISPNEDELFAHYCAIADSTSLPVLVYANPARSSVKISPRLLERLASIGNIVGIKDSTGDLELTAEYVRVTPPDFAVLMGRDTLIFAALLCGAKGAISATANVAPALVFEIYRRFKAGDLEGAKRAQDRIAPLRLAFSWGTFPVVIKEALDLLGMEAGPTRAPVGPLSSQDRARLRDILCGLELFPVNSPRLEGGVG